MAIRPPASHSHRSETETSVLTLGAHSRQSRRSRHTRVLEPARVLKPYASLGARMHLPCIGTCAGIGVHLRRLTLPAPPPPPTHRPPPHAHSLRKPLHAAAHIAVGAELGSWSHHYRSMACPSPPQPRLPSPSASTYPPWCSMHGHQSASSIATHHESLTIAFTP